MSLDMNRLILIARDARDFLMSYFEITKEELKDFPSLKMGGSRLKDLSYFLPPNQIRIHEKYQGENVISHEVGHYLHLHLNEKGFNSGLGKLAENVAKYSEIIYFNKRDPFENPIIKFSTLARYEDVFDINSSKFFSLNQMINQELVRLKLREAFEI